MIKSAIELLMNMKDGESESLDDQYRFEENEFLDDTRKDKFL
jgi:hypothetical protein